MYITLKELCKKTGVSRRSIQCYEKTGLMGPQARNKYGHLLYDVQSQKRAEHIRFLQRIGFSLKEIKLMSESDERAFIDPIRYKLEALKLQRSEMDQLIRTAEVYLNELEDMVVETGAKKEGSES